MCRNSRHLVSPAQRDGYNIDRTAKAEVVRVLKSNVPVVDVPPVADSGALARLLRVAAHDLDLVGRDGLRRRPALVHLERHVLDEESPHLVAETVGIEAALCRCNERITSSAI